jgi:non-heme chloroperoxidase
VPYLTLRDGLPLWYEDYGAGSPIVLVPGWTITTRFWDRQIADLARDHRVVTFDLRGAGNSGKTQSGHSLSTYAEDLHEVLERLELEDVTLVAWALAVSVSVHLFAARGPGRISRFVWVDHSPRFLVAPGWSYALFGDFSPEALDTTLSDLAQDRVTTTRRLLTDAMFAAPLSSADVDWMVAEMMKTPSEVALSLLATVANVDLRPLLPHVGVPVLLVNGRRSVVPSDVGAWLAENLPRATRVVLDEAGHAPFWDDAPGFNRAVRDFAARHGD